MINDIKIKQRSLMADKMNKYALKIWRILQYDGFRRIFPTICLETLMRKSRGSE